LPFIKEFGPAMEAAMNGNNGLRRRWLVGSAAAAGLAVASSAAARDDVTATRKKAADALLTPAEILSRNDAVLQRVMLIYETAMRRAGEGEDIDPVVFSQPAEVARDFFHDFHEKAEQELIYPAFRTAGRMVKLVDVLIAQKAVGGKLTDRIIEAAPKLHAKEQREAMGRDIKAFITMYRPHLAREETDVFPTLNDIVTPDRYGQLASALLKRERDTFGGDGFEAAAKRVAQIENKIGTYDLSVFTAKT
jgi:hemerythrin-like domain-containing protein